MAFRKSKNLGLDRPVRGCVHDAVLAPSHLHSAHDQPRPVPNGLGGNTGPGLSLWGILDGRQLKKKDDPRGEATELSEHLILSADFRGAK